MAFTFTLSRSSLQTCLQALRSVLYSLSVSQMSIVVLVNVLFYPLQYHGMSLNSGSWVEFYDSSVDAIKDIKNGSKLLIGGMY